MNRCKYIIVVIILLLTSNVFAADCSLPLNLKLNTERPVSEEIFTTAFGKMFGRNENISMWADGDDTNRFLFFINEKLVGMMSIRKMEYNSKNIEIIEEVVVNINESLLKMGWKKRGETEIKKEHGLDFLVMKYGCKESNADLTISKSKDKRVLVIDIFFFEKEKGGK